MFSRMSPTLVQAITVGIGGAIGTSIPKLYFMVRAEPRFTAIQQSMLQVQGRMKTEISSSATAIRLEVNTMGSSIRNDINDVRTDLARMEGAASAHAKISEAVLAELLRHGVSARAESTGGHDWYDHSIYFVTRAARSFHFSNVVWLNIHFVK